MLNKGPIRRLILPWLSRRARRLGAFVRRYVQFVREELRDSELDAAGLYYCKRCRYAHYKGSRPCAPPVEAPPPPAPPAPEPPPEAA